jgi:hypothetical protein
VDGVVVVNTRGTLTPPLKPLNIDIFSKSQNVMGSHSRETRPQERIGFLHIFNDMRSVLGGATLGSDFTKMGMSCFFGRREPTLPRSPKGEKRREK